MRQGTAYERELKPQMCRRVMHAWDKGVTNQLLLDIQTPTVHINFIIHLRLKA